MSKLVKIGIKKPINEVIEKIKENAPKFNFIVRNVFNMAHEFKEHHVEVDEGFVYYSIMLCNPEKAYNSISKKPLRGALLLPPKQVVVFEEDGKTIISYVAIEEKDVKELFPEDNPFQKGLSDSCENIVKLMESVK